MRIEFAGVEIAREGDGVTDVINLSPLSRSSNSESIKLIGSRSPFFKRTRNDEYTIIAKVPYSYDDFDKAQTALFKLADMLDELGDGDLVILTERIRLKLANASISAKFPTEIEGCYFEVEYEFKGGNPSSETF